VTPGYLSSTPRVVREADALAAAGYDVRVAFTQGPIEVLRAFDAELLARRPWRTSIFGWSSERRAERWAHFGTGIRHRIAQAIPTDLTDLVGMTERAEGRVYPELAAAARSEPADLFIGHYPVGLAAAARAARRYDAHVGYDVEDLYAETFPEGATWAKPRARILQIESRYVPACSHVSAVSEPVGAAFGERFGTRPIAIHNCHPWAERDRIDGESRERRGEALSLFWFSQTVGLDRGLQDAIRAAGLVAAPVQIHVRGSASPEIRHALASLATDCGVGPRLYFHDSCPPEELLSRAAEHDVGLALETEASLNRRLTVTNKLFLYLTAGLAVAASDLPGQRGVLETCPQAGELHAPGDHQTLARQLDRWSTDAVALRGAKHAALEAARTRWNAEAEGRRLVQAVETLLHRDARRSMASGE